MVPANCNLTKIGGGGGRGGGEAAINLQWTSIPSRGEIHVFHATETRTTFSCVVGYSSSREGSALNHTSLSPRNVVLFRY